VKITTTAATGAIVFGNRVRHDRHIAEIGQGSCPLLAQGVHIQILGPASAPIQRDRALRLVVFKLLDGKGNVVLPFDPKRIMWQTN